MQEPVIEDNGLAWWAGGREDFELMISSGDPDDWALPVTCLSDIVYRRMLRMGYSWAFDFEVPGTDTTVVIYRKDA